MLECSKSRSRWTVDSGKRLFVSLDAIYRKPLGQCLEGEADSESNRYGRCLSI